MSGGPTYLGHLVDVSLGHARPLAVGVGREHVKAFCMYVPPPPVPAARARRPSRVVRGLGL